MTSDVNLAYTGRVPGITWITLDNREAAQIRSTENPAKVVFVFPDRSLPDRELAIEMMQTAPVFADHMFRCHTAFADLGDWSLLGSLRASGSAARLDRIDVAQPVLFAITVSLAKQWQVLGIHPAGVLGHSLGEIAAAYIAGALSLSEAANVVAMRSKALSAIHDCDLDRTLRTRFPVEPISRAAQVEMWVETMREELSGLRARTADTEFISTVTGAGLDTSILDGDYWSANLRQPALFEHAVRWASERGYRTFIEVSPHPELTGEILKALGDRTVDA